MKQIVSNILKSWQSNQAAMLITIIDKSGSTPRGIGAQMLVGKNGLITGTIGGGLVEKEAIDQAILALETGSSYIKNYKLNLQDTSLNMVCGGVLFLHSLYVDKAHFEDAILTIDSKINSEETGFMVIDTEANNLTYSSDVVVSEGVVSIPLPVPDRAIIFGGGHVAKALVPVLSNIGFDCILMENRKEFASKENYPQAREVICGDYDRVEDYINLKPHDYIIIMTHGHTYDYKVLESMLRKKQTYIGVMGSRRKREFVNEKLRLAGFSEDRINSVHAPIGLSIGAVTPEEIAISVAAELIEVRAMTRGQNRK